MDRVLPRLNILLFPIGGGPLHDPLDHLINPATLGGDELMHLLDLIQAKSEKLKSDIDPQQKRALQAINEDSSPIGKKWYFSHPLGRY